MNAVLGWGKNLVTSSLLNNASGAIDVRAHTRTHTLARAREEGVVWYGTNQQLTVENWP